MIDRRYEYGRIEDIADRPRTPERFRGDFNTPSRDMIKIKAHSSPKQVFGRDEGFATSPISIFR